MYVEDFKSMILNEIKRQPAVKSTVLKRVVGQFWPGCRTPEFVHRSKMAETAMKLLIYERKIIYRKGERLMRIAGVKKRELDFLFGGPPCQGYTTVNVNRSVDDPRSKLMFEFVRMIREIKPKVFVIENVPGLVGFKDFFIMLLDVLEKCGYKVRFILMDACSYGVPQHRRRVLIQGVRNDLGYLPTFEPPTHFDDPKNYEGMFPPSAVAVKCFSKNGFSKEEVRDVYWNHKLWILMNKKTAADVVEKAINELIGETMFNHIKTKGHGHGSNVRSALGKKRKAEHEIQESAADVHTAKSR